MFEDLRYLPAFRTRAAELDGFRHLPEATKNQLCPFVTLTTPKRTESSDVSMAALQEIMAGRRHFLDVSIDAPHQDQQLRQLLDSEGEYAAWRDFVAQYDACIPVVQMQGEHRQSRIIRQARALEASHGSLAFRIRDFNLDTTKVVNALASLDAVENALVIVDAGYIRDTFSASLAGTVAVINELREELPEALIAVVSSSWPSSVSAHLNRRDPPLQMEEHGTISILERELHAAIGVDAAIYGDHSAMHPIVALSGGGRFAPRIDYALSDVWEIERRGQRDSSGYIDAAVTLCERFPEIRDSDLWGCTKIAEAAAGQIDGMKQPVCWNAVRVNLHLHQQANLLVDDLTDEENYG